MLLFICIIMLLIYMYNYATINFICIIMLLICMYNYATIYMCNYATHLYV